MLVAVGAAAIGAEPCGHEQPLVSGQHLFLPVERLVMDRTLLLEGLNRPLIDERDAGEQAAGLHAKLVHILGRALQPEGGRGAHGAGTRRECPDRVRRAVHEPTVGRALHRVAREAVLRQRGLVLEEVR